MNSPTFLMAMDWSSSGVGAKHYRASEPESKTTCIFC